MGIGYCLGEWTVRPHRNRIERDSEVVHLAPKAMAVLDRLASASNSVVTRQEIFDSVWPGAAVSDDALTQRVAELRKAFGDSSHEPIYIETIPKIGFRLIPPVMPLSEEHKAGRASQGRTNTGRLFRWLTALGVGLLVITLSVTRFWPVERAARDGPTDAQSPSIAVLPFVNMSEDPGNEYFSDGISEELINLLANVPGLHVISRSSSFSFKGQRMKMTDIARELDASLIVEGTVRKIDNRVRITAQLIDPAIDRHLLSESYDRELSDIFSLQAEIAQSIVTALQDEIGAQTVTGFQPTENIEAYELFLSGRHYFYERGSALDRAIDLLRMAVDKDPDFAEAWAYLAAAACVTWAYRTAISDEDAIRVAEHASNEALALDPELGLGLAVQAMLARGFHGDLNRGFQLIVRAAEKDPHDTTIRLWAGMFTHHWGYLDEAHSHFHYAYTHDPLVGIANGMLGITYLAQGRDDLAAPRMQRATELGWPNHFQTQASQHMMRGEIEDAFAYLNISVVGLGTESVPLPWLDELEAAGRDHIEHSGSPDALISVLERAPERIAFADMCLALVFDLRDPFFEYFSRSIGESFVWATFVMPILWLPEYRTYVEDPRFLDIMGRDGAVELWEQHGYPDGCVRVQEAAGDHLDCSRRYRSLQRAS